MAAVTLAVGLAMLQNYLLYFPERAPLDAIAREGLLAWPADGEFRGLLAEPGGKARGTVVVFHGNAGHAGHRQIYAAILTRLGFRVVLAEYPGYGPRAGQAGEDILVDDARVTLQLAHRMYGAPLFAMGESLGASVAAGAASARVPLVDGLLLITPWDRLEGVAKHHYPWLPVSLLMNDHFDNAAYLSAFPRPVVVVLAESDRIVPPAFGERLYESLRGPKKLTVVAGADHNDWLGRVDEMWWFGVIGFLAGGAEE